MQAAAGTGLKFSESGLSTESNRFLKSLIRTLASSFEPCHCSRWASRLSREGTMLERDWASFCSLLVPSENGSSRSAIFPSSPQSSTMSESTPEKKLASFVDKVDCILCSCCVLMQRISSSSEKQLGGEGTNSYQFPVPTLCAYEILHNLNTFCELYPQFGSSWFLSCQTWQAISFGQPFSAPHQQMRCHSFLSKLSDQYLPHYHN